MAAGPHVSLSAETITTIGSFAVTNSIFTSLIVSALLIGFAAYARTKILSTDKPTGLQNVVELILESLFNLVNSVTENRKRSTALFPFIATFFLFILLNNWLGLFPGVGSINVTYHDHLVPLFRPGTADLNTTLALAIFSVLTTQFFGFKYLSFGYFSKFFNFSSPIMFFVGILEIISEFAKIVSFAFRLFGNIFAGEVLLVVIAFLAPLIVPMPFYGLEFFVGFIQALVFAMLSLVFFNMATISHSDH
jgi:F-type H+-transporting ATPase subunit a